MKRFWRFLVSRVCAIGNAVHGLWYVLRTQRNAWIHASMTIAVTLLAVLLHLPARDWAVLFLAMGMVWLAEFFNTSIEAIVDLASPVHHPLAGIGKDVGAAAVLIAALASILVGLLILGPPLWQYVSSLFYPG